MYSRLCRKSKKWKDVFIKNTNSPLTEVVGKPHKIRILYFSAPFPLRYRQSGGMGLVSCRFPTVSSSRYFHEWLRIQLIAGRDSVGRAYCHDYRFYCP